ncbi:MAG: hypothetical protein PVI23_10335 [Maricaulaceae bacterium]|jgi:hypothetical protein
MSRSSRSNASSPSQSGKNRPPLAVRLTARASIFSLLIALVALLAANFIEPGFVTAGLRLVFIAAGATAAVALILWAAASGLHFIFREDGGKDDDSSLIL